METGVVTDIKIADYFTKNSLKNVYITYSVTYWTLVQ